MRWESRKGPRRNTAGTTWGRQSLQLLAAPAPSTQHPPAPSAQHPCRREHPGAPAQRPSADVAFPTSLPDTGDNAVTQAPHVSTPSPTLHSISTSAGPRLPAAGRPAHLVAGQEAQHVVQLPLPHVLWESRDEDSAQLICCCKAASKRAGRQDRPSARVPATGSGAAAHLPSQLPQGSRAPPPAAASTSLHWPWELLLLRLQGAWAAVARTWLSVLGRRRGRRGVVSKRRLCKVMWRGMVVAIVLQLEAPLHFGWSSTGALAAQFVLTSDNEVPEICMHRGTQARIANVPPFASEASST